MRVFVTGGSGYLGRSIIPALQRHGHEVRALVRSLQAAQVVSELGASAVRGSLQNLQKLREAAAEADAVMHLANDPGPQAADLDRAAAEAMQEGIGGGAYVHTGGVWDYGNTQGVVDEDAPLAPPPVVAWRLENETRVLSRAASGGRPVVVRLGVSYGYGQGYLERLFVQPARMRGTVRYIGSSANRWALVHVEDIAELYVLALVAPAGTVYNGVSEERPLVGEIALSLSRAAGCPGQTASMTLEEARQEMGPFADAFALDQQISAARARTQLGWRPAHHNMLEELAHPQHAQEASAGAARG